jgi:hypothetical protein
MMWRWIYAAVAVCALTVAPRTASGQGQERPNIREVLTAAVLTEADVPRGLALDRSRGGARTDADGRPSYMAAFVADGTGDPSTMAVINIIGQYPDAASGIDSMTDRYRTALRGNWAELPAPAVGEASRASTVTNQVMSGALTTSTTVIAVRRADVVASVAVTSMGPAPQVDVATRLAQAADRRLQAALSPGT